METRELLLGCSSGTGQGDVEARENRKSVSTTAILDQTFDIKINT